MKFIDLFAKAFRRLLPTPFTIALFLTIVIYLVALFATLPESSNIGSYSLELLGFWDDGLWKTGGGGLYFAFQMMLMLVLGHTLALSKPISQLLDTVVRLCKNTASSALIVTLTALLFSFFNWGLGLIVGAILARKVGESFHRSNKKLNYGLIGAAAYSGLMVWHGGLSGSAPIKASESGNIKSMVLSSEVASNLPDSISMADTVFSSMNISVSIALLIMLPLVMYLIGKKSSNSFIPQFDQDKRINEAEKLEGIGKIDGSRIFTLIFGIIILFYAFYKAIVLPENLSLKFLTPNFINLFLLGVVLLFHKNIKEMLAAANEAIKGSTGILIQFPLYFGIMGIMQNSGLLNMVSEYFVSISDSRNFPILTFLSAGLVNIFVPSGGGQWAVQGPIIIQASNALGVPLSKSIMALAYGDQLTNMLQPFWALPLLGITKLKAKDILPYTLILFLVGSIIYGVALFIF